MTKEEIYKRILGELERANYKFPKFNSYHEGYAVLKEEVDELWDEIKQRNVDKIKLRDEAVQVCAMAIKFIESFNL